MFIQTLVPESSTLGPSFLKRSRWWFAGSRFSLTCLGLYVWGVGLPPSGKYIMYLSDMMDHTPWFVVAVLEDVATRLGHVGTSCWIGV